MREQFLSRTTALRMARAMYGDDQIRRSDLTKFLEGFDESELDDRLFEQLFGERRWSAYLVVAVAALLPWGATLQSVRDRSYVPDAVPSYRRMEWAMRLADNLKRAQRPARPRRRPPTTSEADRRSHAQLDEIEANLRAHCVTHMVIFPGWTPLMGDRVFRCDPALESIPPGAIVFDLVRLREFGERFLSADDIAPWLQE